LFILYPTTTTDYFGFIFSNNDTLTIAINVFLYCPICSLALFITFDLQGFFPLVSSSQTPTHGQHQDMCIEQGDLQYDVSSDRFLLEALSLWVSDLALVSSPHECIRGWRYDHRELKRCRLSMGTVLFHIVLCISTAIRVTYFSTRGGYSVVLVVLEIKKATLGKGQFKRARDHLLLPRTSAPKMCIMPRLCRSCLLIADQAVH
ncbi:hypothetical protein KCU92_g120, partial [Aureobasidium melanogenum]